MEHIAIRQQKMWLSRSSAGKYVGYANDTTLRDPSAAKQPPSNAPLDIQTHHLRANSRFEIAGVVLGVIPLMTMAFRSFHDVQALVVEYDHLDQNLQSTPETSTAQNACYVSLRSVSRGYSRRQTKVPITRSRKPRRSKRCWTRIERSRRPNSILCWGRYWQCCRILKVE